MLDVPFDEAGGVGRGLGCGFVTLFVPFMGFEDSNAGLLALPTGLDVEDDGLSKGREG